MKLIRMKKVALLLMFALIALFGFLVINESTNATLYALSFNKIYAVIIFAAIAFGILVVLGIKHFKLPKDKLKKKLMNIFYFVFFVPAVFYPIFRCYFKIPYIFCHVCPRRCIFGHLRPYAIPGVVLMNLDRRFWCFNFCPIGKLQDEQAKLKTKKIKLPKFLNIIRWLVLAFIIVTYFWFLSIARNQPFTSLPWFKNVFSFSLVVLIVAVVILLVSFFVHRFFCNYFCPIGAVGDLVLKLEKKIK